MARLRGRGSRPPLDVLVITTSGAHLATCEHREPLDAAAELVFTVTSHPAARAAMVGRRVACDCGDHEMFLATAQVSRADSTVAGVMWTKDADRQD